MGGGGLRILIGLLIGVLAGVLVGVWSGTWQASCGNLAITHFNH